MIKRFIGWLLTKIGSKKLASLAIEKGWADESDRENLIAWVRRVGPKLVKAWKTGEAQGADPEPEPRRRRIIKKPVGRKRIRRVRKPSDGEKPKAKTKAPQPARKPKKRVRRRKIFGSKRR